MSTNPFDEALEYITDPAKRKTFQEIADEFPKSKGGWLRQSDYSREMNQLKARETEIQKDLEYLEKWKSWKAEQWDDDHQMTKAEIEKENKIQELNAELEIIRAAQETNMTFEEVTDYINKELGKRHVVTKEDLEKEWTPKVVDKTFYNKDVTERLSNIANGLEYLYAETYPLGFSHRDEFGEVLKVRDLVTFANEKGMKDISQAYEAWVGPRRADAAKKKFEEAVAKAKAEGVEEGKKEAGMTSTKMPVDQGPPVMGHVQARRMSTPEEREKDPIPQNAELGKGMLGRMAAEQYRKDQAAGVNAA